MTIRSGLSAGLQHPIEFGAVGRSPCAGKSPAYGTPAAALRRLLQERRVATSSATRSVPRPSERVRDGLEQGVQIEWLRQREDAELAEHLLVLMQRVDGRGADDHRD